jgi:hypothetical protein
MIPEIQSNLLKTWNGLVDESEDEDGRPLTPELGVRSGCSDQSV